MSGFAVFIIVFGILKLIDNSLVNRKENKRHQELLDEIRRKW